MAVILVALATILVLGGLGFLLHLLWWLALVALVLGIAALIVQGPGGHSTPARRRRNG